MQDILGGFAREALQALVPVIAALVVGVLVQALRKYNLDISADQRAKFESVVRRAIQWVEEYYAAKVKAGQPVTGSMKLTSAIGRVQEEVPDKSRDEIAAAILEKLAESPWGASGFPGAPSQQVR